MAQGRDYRQSIDSNATPSEIKASIDARRTSIADKLVRLENEVEAKVRGTVDRTSARIEATVANAAAQVDTAVNKVSSNVQGTADHLSHRVSSTTDHVTTSVEGTINRFTGGVNRSVDGVKRGLDVKRHAELHPLALVGGAILAGIAFGGLSTQSGGRGFKAGLSKASFGFGSLVGLITDQLTQATSSSGSSRQPYSRYSDEGSTNDTGSSARLQQGSSATGDNSSRNSRSRQDNGLQGLLVSAITGYVADFLKDSLSTTLSSGTSSQRLDQRRDSVQPDTSVLNPQESRATDSGDGETGNSATFSSQQQALSDVDGDRTTIQPRDPSARRNINNDTYGSGYHS